MPVTEHIWNLALTTDTSCEHSPMLIAKCPLSNGAVKKRNVDRKPASH